MSPNHPRTRKAVDPSALGPPLPPLNILAILTSRGDGTFHWAIGLTGNPSDPEYLPRTFRKCHATQLNGPSWEFEDVEHNIEKLQHIKPLCVAVKMGTLQLSTATETARDLLADVPMGELSPELQISETIFTCRTWFKAAAMRLHEAGMVAYKDIDELEKDLRGFAQENDAVVIQGGPYRVYDLERARA